MSVMDITVADIILAFCTIVIAIANVYLVNESKRSSRGQLLNDLLSHYSSPEMENSLKILTHYSHVKETYEQIQAERAKDPNKESHMPTELKIEESRRQLHWYIKSAYILYENGLLSKKLFADAVIRTNGFALWENVCIPLARDKKLAFMESDDLSWADDLISKAKKYKK